MLSGQIADILEGKLQSGNIINYRRELINIYQQIIPSKDNSTKIGPYHYHKETFRKEPKLVHCISRLLIDAGLVAESDKVMKYFLGERKTAIAQTTLSKHERKNLVEYINSSLFGKRFFNRRYGISDNQKKKPNKFVRSFKKRNEKSNKSNSLYDERDFQRRYGIGLEQTDKTTGLLLCLEDETLKVPEPIFATSFNERYGIGPPKQQAI
jgi:hypothetical protein